MTPRAAQLVEGADQALTTAQRGLETRDLEAAAERACVAMLRLAKACLDVDGLSPGPANAVCTEYGQHFGTGGRMYSAYFRWLLDAAATVVERAEIFRDAVTRLLQRSH